ncbi:MAG: chitobiase/beta-hexosaminidase C-terminal domain-containing protein [Opitutaceae bacterium]
MKTKILATLVFSAVFLSNSASLLAQTQVALPSFTPPAGYYPSNPLPVTISTTTPGASIRYTLNGTTPTESDGTLYTGPVNITTPYTVLTAVAYEAGYEDSGINVGQFIVPAQTMPPIFSPQAGAYTSTQYVAITSPSLGTPPIYYTTDGSTPTATHGTLYSNLVPIGSSLTLQAITGDGNSYAYSSVTSGIYSINGNPVALAPSFSPPGGNYSGAQSLSTACRCPTGCRYPSIRAAS